MDIIDFMEWLGPRFRCEGVGLWVDCENDEKGYTSEEVIELYKQEL